MICEKCWTACWLLGQVLEQSEDFSIWKGSLKPHAIHIGNRRHASFGTRGSLGYLTRWVGKTPVEVDDDL
jgi:hypothetical protein